jgi:hypothetical protein
MTSLSAKRSGEISSFKETDGVKVEEVVSWGI